MTLVMLKIYLERQRERGLRVVFFVSKKAFGVYLCCLWFCLVGRILLSRVSYLFQFQNCQIYSPLVQPLN